MNDQQPTPSFDESVAQVMQTLPPVIRTYLAQGKYTMVTKGLMTKYGLRIDQGGVLEREIMLLLMGIENPDEFTQALVEEARIDPKAVANIVQDINTQIFVPLREEEMKSKAAGVQPIAAQPQRPVNAPVPNYTAPVAELPRGSYAPPPQSPRYPGQENANVNAFVRRVPQGPLNTDRPSVSVIPPPSPVASDKWQGASPTPSSAPAARPQIPVPQMPIPTPLQQALRSVVPPANLPGAMPPRPDVSDKVQGVSSSVPLRPSNLPLTPSSAPYSSDPYHEPIE